MNPTTYFKQEACIWTRKYGFFAWAVGEFEIHNEFRTHLVDFELVKFSPTCEFEIDLELTQISNSTIGDRVWSLRHVETSLKCLYPIWNALYSFITHNFWSFFFFFFLLMTFPFNKCSMRVCHMLGYWWYYIKSLSSRVQTSWIFLGI